MPEETGITFTETKVTFKPDYDTPCKTCGQTPTVTGVDEEGKEVHCWNMCGVCCFGEAKCIDPEEW